MKSIKSSVRKSVDIFSFRSNETDVSAKNADNIDAPRKSIKRVKFADI